MSNILYTRDRYTSNLIVRDIVRCVNNICEFFFFFLRQEEKPRTNERANKQKCRARRDWNKRIDLTDWCADGISSAREPPHQPLNRIKRNCNAARYYPVAFPLLSRADAARFIARIDFVVSLAVVNKNASLIS